MSKHPVVARVTCCESRRLTTCLTVPVAAVEPEMDAGGATTQRGAVQRELSGRRRTLVGDGCSMKPSIQEQNLGRIEVRDYQMRQLGSRGEILDSADFSATSDETAINFAASNAGLEGVELWTGSCFVALVKRDRRRPSGSA